jgi:hypothetical protein
MFDVKYLKKYRMSAVHLLWTCWLWLEQESTPLPALQSIVFGSLVFTNKFINAMPVQIKYQYLKQKNVNDLQL